MTSVVVGGRPSRAVSEQMVPRIIKAGTHIFLRDGYEKTSMDAVAAEAGISKRTLYSRFPGKADLFEAVVNDVLQKSLGPLDARRILRGTLYDSLLAFAENLLACALVPDVIALERVVAGEARQFPKLAARLHVRIGDYVVGLLSELIEHFHPARKRQRAAVRRDAELFLALIVLAPLRKAMLFQSEPGISGEDRLAVARAVQIFVKGIAP